MLIAVARESDPAEPRVAGTPETVKKLKALGAQVAVERGAGLASGILDADYEAAGASVGENVTKDADVVLKVRRPSAAEVAGYKKGALVIAIMDPYGNEAALKQMADAGVMAFAMELMPRITRAQSMDVLSSQANLAGYRAVIDAAEEFGRAFPMMMTAAGTVPAAKVFIMGVGVAGLQAIATARRLGAIVTATDVRPATKEQVESLGAKFLAVEDEEFKNAQTAGGYAKPMSPEYQAKQAALTAEHIKKQDIVITTALIPGRPAPRLITKEMVASMRPGSVIIDLAVERGGNVEGAKAGRGGESRRRQDRRLSERGGAAGGLGLGALRQEPADVPRHHDRQERKEACGQLGRRDRQGHAVDPRGQDRASELYAEGLRSNDMEHIANAVDPFVFRLSIFVLAVFVGYYVVWSVTPALHTPLMSVTNAISSVIVVGALAGGGRGADRKRQRHDIGARLRLRRAHLCFRQHLRRLPGHPAHAGDVPEEKEVTRPFHTLITR